MSNQEYMVGLRAKKVGSRWVYEYPKLSDAWAITPTDGGFDASC